MTLEILLDSIMGNIFEIIATIITIAVSYYVLPLIKNSLVPWLKEKRVYDTIKKLVKAAEKMSESGMIQKVDKKAMVIKWLEEQGIEVTDEISALIEAAVKELDIIVSTTVDEIKK